MSRLRTGTGTDAVLVENCRGVTTAARGGRVSGGGGIRPAARTDFPDDNRTLLQNLAVTDQTTR
ncbi:hypothetical protein Q5530_34150 [Saccharothrix sp. BKS2]|uniref:hypothetical protein n=1 Tax=Saccharothrix sp. BKS2 TaxID=3064400 RepID=UPI0039E8CAA6